MSETRNGSDASTPPLSGFLASLRTARSAAIGGIIFSILFSVVLIMFRLAFPYEKLLDPNYLPPEGSISSANLALALVPYAGIAFIWFMAAINYNLGAADNRLFSTVFIGSGILFTAIIFVAAAFGAAEINALAQGFDTSGAARVIPGVAVNKLLLDYAARMASVFTLSLSAFGRSRKALPTWLTAIGTIAGLFLFLVPVGVPYVEFVFPVWVSLLSVYLFVTHPRRMLHPQAPAQG